MSEELLLRNLGRSGDGQDLEAQTNVRNASVLARWGRFNLVGLIGVVVQFAMLFLLNSTFHLHYLVATTVAVETAVLHNFVWHEKYTWTDRIKAWQTKPPAVHDNRRPCSLEFSAAFFGRLWRFHLANGAVSILGNLAIMKALVDLRHVNYLIANLTAIAVCSLANFVLSDHWVFQK
jgi:putative flippase GtrA